MIPWTDLPQIFIRELGRATGMFLAWFSDSKFNGSTFVSNVSYLGKIDQVRVNAGVTMSLVALIQKYINLSLKSTVRW